MKKTMRRLMAMLLAIAMVLTILPLGVLAADDMALDVKNGFISLYDLSKELGFSNALGLNYGIRVFKASDLPGDGTAPTAAAVAQQESAAGVLTEQAELENGVQYAAFKATKGGTIFRPTYTYDYANPICFTAKVYREATVTVSGTEELGITGGVTLNGEAVIGTVKVYEGETYVVDVVPVEDEKQAVDLMITVDGVTTVVEAPYTLPNTTDIYEIEASYYKNLFATVDVEPSDYGTVTITNCKDNRVTEGNTFSVNVDSNTAEGWFVSSVAVTKDGEAVEAVDGVYGPVVDGEAYSVTVNYEQSALEVQDGEINFQTAKAASGAGSLDDAAMALEQEIFDAVYVSSYPTTATLEELRAAGGNYLEFDANGEGRYQPVYFKKGLIELLGREPFATDMGDAEKVRLTYHFTDSFGNHVTLSDYAVVTLSDLRPATQIVVENADLSFVYGEVSTDDELMEALGITVLDESGNQFDIPEGATITLEHDELVVGDNSVTIWYNSPASDPDHATSKTTVTVKVTKAPAYIRIEDQNVVYGDPIEINVDTNVKDYLTGIIGVDVLDTSLNGFVSIHLPESAKTALYIQYSVATGAMVKLTLAGIDATANTELSKYAGNDYLDLYSFIVDYFKDGITLESLGSLLDIMDLIVNHEIMGGMVPDDAKAIYEALRQVFDYLEGMKNSLPNGTDRLTIYLDKIPNEIGVYGILAVTTDSNFTIAADAGYLTIRTRTPQNSDLTIAFTTPIEDTLTEEEAKSFVFGGMLSENGEPVPDVKVTAIYTGTNAYGETVSSAAPIRVPGTYTETLSVVTLQYYAVVSRDYTIAKDQHAGSENNDHELGTFTVATYNVDGLPTGMFGNNVVINQDGPGSEGTVAISQKLAEAGWDVIGVSENFNYNKDLMSALDGYSAGTFRGGLNVLNVLEGIQNQSFRLDSDGLNLIWKNDISVSLETWTPWNIFNGYLINGNDGLVTKGYRHYVATVAEGVDVDVYILHMDADSTELDTVARNAQWRQLVSAIKNSDTTNPIIVMGDTNSRYTREMLESLFINSINADPRFTAADAWVELTRDGEYPAYGSDSIMDGDYPEIVDKILFINNNTSSVQLIAKSYTVDTSFEDEEGNALSDHQPVVVEFGYTVKEHVFEASVTTPATCTEDGEMTFVCQKDGFSYTEVIPALGHEHQLSETVEPTCTETGSETYACVRCEDSYTEIIPAKGHSCEVTEVAPTCEAEGYNLHTCTVCGYSYRDNVVAATGHSYEPEVIEPTCEIGGHTVYRCTACGQSYVDDFVEPTGHTWGEWVIETANSCVTDGVRTRTCTVCQATETEAIAAAGHSFETTTEEVTCVKDGCDVHTCTVCGYAYHDNIVEAAGHSYSTVVTDPTCTTMGYTTYTCDVCGDSYVADIQGMIAHDYQVTTEVPASCVCFGYKVSTCSVCNSKTTDILELLDHSYEVTTVAPTCTEDGYDLHVCSVCGDSYRDNEIPATGHDTVLVNAKDETCTEDGYTGDLVCQTCGTVVEEGEIIDALDHDYDCCVCLRCGHEMAAPVILEQPVDFVGAVGETAYFTVVTDRTNVNYQWYYSQDGGETWLISALPGYNTATIEVPMKNFRDGQLYKCVITDCLEHVVETEIVSMSLPKAACQIVSQPESVTAFIGERVQFHVEAIGEGLTYQWEYSKNGGVTWTKSGLTGAQTDTLTVGVTSGRNGQMYRCLIIDSDGLVLTSASATMTSVAAPKK